MAVWFTPQGADFLLKGLIRLSLRGLTPAAQPTAFSGG
ncbi:MAG: hypothetical protein AVDCRST_MAG93-8559 [uncultured Chloroflexia bacterium]|uniref:Uncharacterized protein n=1 Tax=uncultured Chloroflexia bacterium TaxID=1672391 RepID=A0A6J4MZ13_9CHLR|nr:MAG: hypothetical protein AVDCRST_MAG93-8559 [uncultured Chloroflexia bacterium]